MSPCVIIPCNRVSHIDNIVQKLLNTSDAIIVVVLDRIMHEFKPDPRLHVIQNSIGDGFQAGRARDVGLAYAESLSDQYIFIDDDCIPQSDVVKSHAKWLSCSTPLITIGRRAEKQYQWQDKRETPQSLGNMNLFDARGTMVNNTDLIKQCMCIWTCNCGINKKAVTIIRRLMKRFYGTDRIFHPAFDGKWGGEDSFLSYIAWAAHVGMFYLPNGSNAVMHQDHPRPSTTYNTSHIELLNEEIGKLCKKLAMDKLQPSMFEC